MRPTDVREHNLSAILRAVQRSSSPISRAGLAAETRLTKPTVSKLVEDLLISGLLSEGAPRATGAGRPMVPLHLAHGTLLAIGLEIAADKVSCLAIDAAGREVVRRSVHGHAATARAAIEASVDLVGAVRDERPELPIAGVVVAVPGRISPGTAHVLSAPNLEWTDVPLVDQLRESLPPGCGSVFAQNDNRLSVLTEIDRRPGASFLYVRGSTGVGGAIVLQGNVLEGAHGWAGEIGHTVVAPGGRLCRCGRYGCLEAYVSRAALSGAGSPMTVAQDDRVGAPTGPSSDRAEAMGIIGRYLGLAVANALNILDLSTVVFSGYLAPVAAELAPAIRETVADHALSAEAAPVAIEGADPSPDPALRGAARAALHTALEAPGAWIAQQQSNGGRGR